MRDASRHRVAAIKLANCRQSTYRRSMDRRGGGRGRGRGGGGQRRGSTVHSERARCRWSSQKLANDVAATRARRFTRARSVADMPISRRYRALSISLGQRTVGTLCSARAITDLRDAPRRFPRGAGAGRAKSRGECLRCSISRGRSRRGNGTRLGSPRQKPAFSRTRSAISPPSPSSLPLPASRSPRQTAHSRLRRARRACMYSLSQLRIREAAEVGRGYAEGTVLYT